MFQIASHWGSTQVCEWENTSAREFRQEKDRENER